MGDISRDLGNRFEQDDDWDPYWDGDDDIGLQMDRIFARGSQDNL